MKRRWPAINTFVVLSSFAAVALAFQTAIRFPPCTHQCSTHAPSCWDNRLNLPTNGRAPRRGGGGGSVVMMARANRLKSVIARQKKLDRSNAPVILSDKAKRKAKRERRAYFRERYACSGRRLIKLQQEDPDSFYIGFVGTNLAGRAQALVAVQAYLKRATELKVCCVFVPAALCCAVLLYINSKVLVIMCKC